MQRTAARSDLAYAYRRFVKIVCGEMSERVSEAGGACSDAP
jgi:hypothetical protein